MNALPRFIGRYRAELLRDELSSRGLPLERLEEQITLDCLIDGQRRLFTVPAGYKTDGASVPAFAWRFIPPGTRAKFAAPIHDFLYENRVRESEIGLKAARREADLAFLEGMKAAGVVRWRRSVMFRAVRAFGGRGWGKAAGK